ncbi:exopolysaccharide biosynthesis protein [Pseudorhizobium tarimense]|uniref:exopolysaccharide biosynthesis protein n=1 Tax=Pseudorhizobium tarimense TaxID=1079109 RepID=UPI0033971F43
MIPIPGPFGLVFGSALTIVALQFAFGVRRLCLPSLFATAVSPPKPSSRCNIMLLQWSGKASVLCGQDG